MPSRVALRVPLPFDWPAPSEQRQILRHTRHPSSAPVVSRILKISANRPSTGQNPYSAISATNATRIRSGMRSRRPAARPNDAAHATRLAPPRRASAAFPIRSASPVRTVHDPRNDRRHSTAPGGSRILQNSATGPSTDPNPYSLNSATDATTIRLGTPRSRACACRVNSATDATTIRLGTGYIGPAHLFCSEAKRHPNTPSLKRRDNRPTRSLVVVTISIRVVSNVRTSAIASPRFTSNGSSVNILSRRCGWRVPAGTATNTPRRNWSTLRTCRPAPANLRRTLGPFPY